MAWTYHKETTASGRWALYRSASGHKDQAYYVQEGWIESDLLFRRRSKGDMDAADIIPEEEAKRLIEGVSATT